MIDAFQRLKRLAAGALLMSAATLGAMNSAQAAATIVINNLNAAGVGFNDPTPATPVGGNPGTTLGAQRLNAFTHAANIWGATLTSNVVIVINAQMTALACTATSATLGSAGASSIFRNFANAPFTNTWYSYALANKLAGTYLGTLNAAQINANFNANLGLNANCLPGRGWYLGLDGNHGTDIDFIPVLIHELGHGLGFQTFTNGTTGAFQSGLPSIWDRFLFSAADGKTWADPSMNNARRAASAISKDGLVWAGANVTANVPNVLSFGLAGAAFSGVNAGTLAGRTVRVGEADFGPSLGSSPTYGEVMPILEQTAGAGEGCEPFNAANAAAASGRVVFITLGTCTVATKTKNAQNAGAKAVLIGDTVAENAVQPSPLGGWDKTITIPTARLFLSDASALRTQLLKRTRTGTGVFASLGRNAGATYAGADMLNRALMYAPNPFISGSSVSHFDRTAFRNQLMEPNISNDLTQSVLPPQDLTLQLFRDIGW
jgi:PA domain